MWCCLINIWSHCSVGEGRACWSLGNAHTALGNHEQAMHFAEKHLEIAKEVTVYTFPVLHNSCIIKSLAFICPRHHLVASWRTTDYAVYSFDKLYYIWYDIRDVPTIIPPIVIGQYWFQKAWSVASIKAELWAVFEMCHRLWLYIL